MFLSAPFLNGLLLGLTKNTPPFLLFAGLLLKPHWQNQMAAACVRLTDYQLLKTVCVDHQRPPMEAEAKKSKLGTIIQDRPTHEVQHRADQHKSKSSGSVDFKNLEHISESLSQLGGKEKGPTTYLCDGPYSRTCHDIPTSSTSLSMK